MNGKLIGSLECFKRNIAYVPQDDIIHDDLSVEENIVYPALLFNKRGYITAVEVLLSVQRYTCLERNRWTAWRSHDERSRNLTYEDPEKIMLKISRWRRLNSFIEAWMCSRLNTMRTKKWIHVHRMYYTCCVFIYYINFLI